MNQPPNLHIEEDADYRIDVLYPDNQDLVTLYVRGRSIWKKMTAINHALYFAKRNPKCHVYVHRVR